MGVSKTGRYCDMDATSNLSTQIDCSVIIVDWGTGALQAEYKQAVINSQVPGRQIAKIVFQLMEKTGGKIDPTRVHWMGHSLGAQMSIYFWDWLKELTNGRRIAKITGE